MFINIFLNLLIISKIIFIKSENINSNFVSLKFRTFYPYSNNSDKDPSSFNTEDYFEKIHLSKIYLEVGTGEENNFSSKTNQTLNIIVNLKENIFSTTNLYFEKYTTENNNLLCHYNSSLSTSLTQTEKYYEIYQIETLSSYAKEYFKIYTDISLLNYVIKKLNFVNTINHNVSNICGSIGLGYTKKESIDYNFIGQLHKKFNLSDYYILFNYTSPKIDSDEGVFIFGSVPYDIDDFVPIYSIKMQEPVFDLFGLKIEREGYKIEERDIQKKMKIDPDIEGIVFPKFYYTNYEDIIFEKYYNKKICHKETYGKIYSVIYCDAGDDKFGQSNINAFPNLKFYVDKMSNFSISFKGEDLFYYKNNKYFFKIVCDELGNQFILGRILFKKYLTILNQDKKQIYFYNGKNNNGNEKDEIINMNNSSSNITLIIIVALLGCAVVFFIIGIFFGKKLFKKRGKVAYELNDGYDYSPAQNGKEHLAINE